jgi:hypothetical protein
VPALRVVPCRALGRLVDFQEGAACRLLPISATVP